MKKQRMQILISLAILTLSVLLAQPAMGVGRKDNTNFMNGKPFAYLGSLIDANRERIAALESRTEELQAELDALSEEMDLVKEQVEGNSVKIADLKNEMDLVNEELVNIGNDINQINDDMDALSSDVEGNADKIAALELKLKELEEAFALAEDQIKGLENLIAAEIALIQMEIASLTEEMDAIHADTSEQIQTIRDELKALSESAGSGTVTEADIIAINIAMAELLAQLNGLSLLVTQNTLDIMDLKFILADVQSVGLDHYHRYRDRFCNPGCKNPWRSTSSGKLP